MFAILRNFTLIVAILITSACVRTTPREVSLWNKCDGYAAPEDVGKLMGRGTLTIATLGIVNAMPEQDKPWARAKGAMGVTACDEALSQPVLDSYPLRKVNILRAHAIHNLEAGNWGGAELDVAAMKKVAQTLRYDARDMKSVDSAIQAVEAVIYFNAGKMEEGYAIARGLVMEQPYSKTYISNVLAIMPKDWPWYFENHSILNQLAKFSTENVHMQAMGSLIRDEGELVSLEAWSYLVQKNYQPPNRNMYSAFFRKPKKKKEDVPEADKEAAADVLMHAAVAAARANQPEQALHWINKAETTLNLQAVSLNIDINELADKPVNADKLQLVTQGDIKKEVLNLNRWRANSVEFSKSELKKLVGILAQYRAVINAYRYLGDGALDEACDAYLTLTNQKINRITMVQIRSLLASVPAGHCAGLKSVYGGKFSLPSDSGYMSGKVAKMDYARLFQVAPVWKPYIRHDSYSSNIPLLKAEGFKDKELEDNLWSIEFMGTASSLINVEEMSLLRAAEIVKKQGGVQFIVEEQASYIRSQTTYMNGTAIGTNNNAGYKAVLQIRILKAKDISALTSFQKQRIFDAGQVYNDLAKIYIKPKREKKTAT